MVNKTTTSKKRSKKNNFYFTILSELNLNNVQTVSGLGKKYGISKQNVLYYTRQLITLKLIEKKGYGTWQITKKGIELLEKPNPQEYFYFLLDKIKTSKNYLSLGMMNFKKGMEIHAIQIKIPIESGIVDLKKEGGRINEGFKNWIPEYLDFAQPISITIRNNNNKSISAFITSHRITKLSNIIDIVSSVKLFLFNFFKERNIKLDVWNSEVINTDISREDDVAEQKLRKGDKVTQKFDKNRKKILEKDPEQQSKAWIDTSPEPSLETNDLDYMYAYLKMPFRVETLENRLNKVSEWVLRLSEGLSEQTKNIVLLTEQINLHIPAIVKLGENAEKMGKNVETFSKEIKNFNRGVVKKQRNINRLIQNDLKRWL